MEQVKKNKYFNQTTLHFFLFSLYQITSLLLFMKCTNFLFLGVGQWKEFVEIQRPTEVSKLVWMIWSGYFCCTVSVKLKSVSPSWLTLPPVPFCSAYLLDEHTHMHTPWGVTFGRNVFKHLAKFISFDTDNNTVWQV